VSGIFDEVICMTRHDGATEAVAGGGWAGVLAGLLSFAAFLPGCAVGKQENPSFPLTVKQAKADLRWMRDHPVKLQRPVVVLGGWGDVMGLPPAYLAEQLRRAVGDDRIISIGFGMCTTFDACRKRVLKRVDAAYPPEDPAWTREVDVVGFSMGGIVARYATSPTGEGGAERRLRIANLYTISTPHRGASMSKVVAPGSLARDMRPGSKFLEVLDREQASVDYPILPYVRLEDTIVGADNAAPAGQTPWWLPARAWSRSHTDAYRDPRLVAEIARRLRGEEAFTTEPAVGVPGAGSRDDVVGAE
jgi:pimeloyl-ACP methyl ester carboxylesterase